MKTLLCLIIILFFSGNAFAAEQWDKHRVAVSATLGGLSGGIVGAAAGHVLGYALDVPSERRNVASLGIGFPLGFAIGTYVGAEAAINKLYFPDELNAGRVALYSVGAGISAYLLWRWAVEKYGYEKGMWPFWSIIPLALLGARVGTNNTFYIPISMTRF